jgi:glycosyltransferase 2 family protein
LAAAVTPERARRGHPYRAYVIRAGVGVAVIAFLLSHYDARPILRILSHEGVGWFAAALALYIAGQVMSTWRWMLLAYALELRGAWIDFLRFYFIGMFTNTFVPGLVGGDAARAYYLGRRYEKMGAAIAATIADRFYGLLALFWLAAFAVVFLSGHMMPPSVTHPTVVIGAIAFAGFLASPLIARVVDFLPHQIRRWGEIVVPYLRRPQMTIVPILLSFALQVSLAFCQWLLARGLALDVPVTLFIVVVPIANVFASLPLTLNGLGVRETAYLFLFGLAGIRHEDAIALGLLWFVATMLGGLTGGIAFVTTRTDVIDRVSVASKPVVPQ